MRPFPSQSPLGGDCPSSPWGNIPAFYFPPHPLALQFLLWKYIHVYCTVGRVFKKEVASKHQHHTGQIKVSLQFTVSSTFFSNYLIQQDKLWQQYFPAPWTKFFQQLAFPAVCRHFHQLVICPSCRTLCILRQLFFQQHIGYASVFVSFSSIQNTYFSN